MARSARKADSTFVLLMGNLHARKVKGNPFGGDRDYAWLATLLPGPLTSLDVRGPEGSA